MDRTRRILVSSAAALLALTAACGDFGSGDPTAAPTTTSNPVLTVTSTTTTAPPVTTTSTTTTTEPPPEHAIRIDAVGWPELTNGAHYEGWLIIDGDPVSTGRFNAQFGAVVDLDGNVVDEFPLDFDPAAATAVVVTIEPADDEDPAPSGTKVLAGDLAGGTAALTVDHPAALGTDFADATGEFVLATPTDGDRINDEFSGVWFLVFPGPTAGLDLPMLPAGWTYEGWTLIDDVPVTTGTFLRVDASDDAAPYSGTVRTPNFPGEDFLQNAPDGLTFPVNLSGATVVISIEPLTENNPRPFPLKPLAGPVPTDAELEPVAYPLTNDGFLPFAGVATIR